LVLGLEQLLLSVQVVEVAHDRLVLLVQVVRVVVVRVEHPLERLEQQTLAEVEAVLGHLMLLVLVVQVSFMLGLRFDMAHFAKINNNVVKEIIVIANDDAPTESAGQAFIASLGLDGEWLQTSYNNNFRGTYAGIGYVYDAELDKFIKPVEPVLPSEE
jgi:hypothetical protein